MANDCRNFKGKQYFLCTINKVDNPFVVSGQSSQKKKNPNKPEDSINYY